MNDIEQNSTTIILHKGDNVSIKLQAPSSDKGLSVATLLIGRYTFSFVVIIDTVSPKFTSSNLFTVTVQNEKTVGTIKALDKDKITYSIKKNKYSKLFNIDSSSGVITFVDEPFFKINFKYNITVIATDTYENYDTQNLIIKYDRYIRTSNEIVIDNYTGYMWQDNTSIKRTERLGKDYCTSLALGGYGDWQFPDHWILREIVDKTRENPAISPIFQNIESDKYWNSTVSSINFSNGDSTYPENSDNQYYIRCYRDTN